MRAIQITEFGGPEVLQQVELPDPVPAEGEVLINVSRAGLNYADTHQAENSYLAQMTLPLVPGGEIVGTTADGRRVVALTKSSGGYAEKAVAPELTTFDVPDGVDDLTALSLIVQGATAWLLIGSIPGVLIGSQMSVKLPERSLRMALAVTLALAGLKLLEVPGANAIFVTALVAAAVAGLVVIVRRLSRRPALARR